MLSAWNAENINQVVPGSRAGKTRKTLGDTGARMDSIESDLVSHGMCERKTPLAHLALLADISLLHGVSPLTGGNSTRDLEDANLLSILICVLLPTSLGHLSSEHQMLDLCYPSNSAISLLVVLFFYW